MEAGKGNNLFQVEFLNIIISITIQHTQHTTLEKLGLSRVLFLDHK